MLPPFQRSLRILAALALLVVFSSTMRQASAADDLCFPQTSLCITGRFREYWEQNGGLAVFGYPITPMREERNRDTGQTYLTQWFERNRFEFHPENAAPYDVLLGRLGDDRLLQSGRAWREEGREASQEPGCLWFAETGHNVCDQGAIPGFRHYWESHGLAVPGLDAYQRSLALFGLPLTAPRTEIDSSGDTVITQWFERARFEWHPDKPAEFQVLLGRLGAEVLQAGAYGPPPPGRIVYVGAKDIFSGGDLYMMNAGGTEQTRLTSTNSIPLEAAEYAVSPTGDRIAYRTGRELVVFRIEGNGTAPLTIATHTGSASGQPELFSPVWAPDGSYLAFVWKNDIYVSRADGSPPIRLTQSGDIAMPACLSWARNGYLAFRATGHPAFKIVVVRSDGSDLRHVGWGLCPALSPAGDRIAYMSGGDFHIMNLDGTGERALTSGRSFARPIWSPDGTRLLTVGNNSGNPYDTDIYVVDAGSGAVRQLTTDPNLDTMPSWLPEGRYITFASKRTLRYGVYIMRADGTNQTQLSTPEESAAPQWAAR